MTNIAPQTRLLNAVAACIGTDLHNRALASLEAPTVREMAQNVIDVYEQSTAKPDDSQYLDFYREQPPGRKTPVVSVRSSSSGLLLGRIAWFNRWRQFCFMPEPDTVFNMGCLYDIKAKIAELQAERT